MTRRILVAMLAALVLALTVVVGAGATAGPIGPLPPGPTTTISTVHGTLVSVVLPPGAQGRSWRQAGTYDPKVMSEVTEANVGKNVVIVFKTLGAGTATVKYGLTRGETKKAYASATFVVRVS
jgi:hypothetical protein